MCVCVSITSSQNFRVQLMIFICNFCFIPLIWSEQIDFTFHWFGLCWISICNSIELDAKCKIQYIMDCTWFENTHYQTDEWPAKVGTQVFDSLVFFLKFFCSYNCNDYYTLLLLKLKKSLKSCEIQHRRWQVVYEEIRCHVVYLFNAEQLEVSQCIPFPHVCWLNYSGKQHDFLWNKTTSHLHCSLLCIDHSRKIKPYFPKKIKTL